MQNKNKNKNKTCKRFCEKVFLPERERVEEEFSKKSNKPNMFKNYKYIPIKVLRKTNKSLAKLLKNSFMKTCDDIYCQKTCKANKKKWLKSFTKKRRERLTEQGAVSGCRDLTKEFPEYYKNI